MNTQAPLLTGVLETSLYVDDLDRAEAFYARVLGFGRFLRDNRMCAMGVPGAAVLLLFRRGGSVHPSPTPGGIIPAHDGHGPLHLCLAIPRRSLSPWQEHLGAQSIPIESRVDWPYGGVSLYFRDPDGNSLEIATPGLWPNY